MRFSTFTSLALTLAAAVTAAPVTASQGLTATGSGVPSAVNITLGLSAGDNDKAPNSGLNLGLDIDTDDLDARGKYKASKITLNFPKTLEKGSIPQNQREDATDLGKKAMYQADVKEGTVIYGWHDERTEDPVEHFTINPSEGSGASNGKIHVHRDGSWTQGAGGNAASGDGQV
jgi:hypothetical protein